MRHARRTPAPSRAALLAAVGLGCLLWVAVTALLVGTAIGGAS